jgi:serine/alanine adding enzyme
LPEIAIRHLSTGLASRPAGSEADWQRYVEGNPRALYHSLAWRDILHRTFGHRSHYLMAVSEGRTRGVLPLFEMQGPLFGHFFVSLPFLNYGGIVADGPEFESALAEEAARLAASRKARHIELRQSAPGAGWTDSNWHLRQHKAALVVPLAGGTDALWAALSSRLRGKVRKAEKSGVVFCAGGVERLPDFYHVFSLNMRDLGTPVYSPAFFTNVVGGAGATVLLAHREGRPVAGAIAVRTGGRMELPWICSDYSQSSYYANEFLYWNAISWAFGQGAGELDLGRSSIDAGTYKFKVQWNPEIRPLFWYYWLAPGARMPELNPSNPKYALAVNWWKKMPMMAANRIGPWIARNIP